MGLSTWCVSSTAASRLSSSRPTPWQANAGDCRAVLCKQGQALVLSRDHKVNRSRKAEALPCILRSSYAHAADKERVIAAGGVLDDAEEYLQLGDRKLSVSRALGNYEFKQRRDCGPDDQIVTACPEIAIANLKGDEEFLVLACDGGRRPLPPPGD